MIIGDFVFISLWWTILFIIGLVFFPITASIFSRFFDRGYIFSKILALILLSYTTFFLGIIHIAKFTTVNLVIIFLGLTIISFLVSRSFSAGALSFAKTRWKILIFEEFLFFTGILFWSYIRGHAPEIHGLEKYMDFGFVNSILRSEYFPPRDMWFTPFSINYYYFGHLITAVLTKLSGIPSFISYNLMIATLFAFTFVCSFSIGLNLVYSLRDKRGVAGEGDPRRAPAGSLATEDVGRGKSPTGPRAILGGLLSGFLVALSGNLHTLYTLFKPYQNENPVPFWNLAFSPQTFPNSYWYPNATRFIHNTIHEFPIYSFVVSDLHGHVISIPIVLTIIALLLNLFLEKRIKLSFLLLISFLLSTAYMTNAWDGIIYFLLTAMVIFYFQWQRTRKDKKLNTTNNPIIQVQPINPQIKNARTFLLNNWIIDLFIGLFVYLFILGAGFLIFTLPFSLFFKPFVSGIGILCSPEFLTKIGHLGPFLFEKDHCQISPWWQLATLYGFFYFFVISFIIFLFKKQNPKHEYRNPKQTQSPNDRNLKRFNIWDFGSWDLFRNWKPALPVGRLDLRNLHSSDIFVFILIILSTILIILPEFIYVKDIYPAHYRANTMFKLVYQAFMMLSLSSAYIIVRINTNFKFHPFDKLRARISNFKLFSWQLVVFVCIGSIGLFFVLLYPYFATKSYYGDLKTYKGLDGLKYLNDQYPTDYQAILWLNKNIKGQPVILEAQGDSYTDHARVSANTGLPTVLGWTVHEWLWRGTYDIPAPRIQEVTNLYESDDIELTKNLIKKYNIRLVFIGDLERQKYQNLKGEKFRELGKLIFEKGETKIYRLN